MKSLEFASEINWPVDEREIEKVYIDEMSLLRTFKSPKITPYRGLC